MGLFACVHVGGFTLAAKRLDTSKPRLSRRIAKLETRFGVKLLHRTTRRLALELALPDQAAHRLAAAFRGEP
jgi:DNA-binding transcriptional LysR family regulator